MKCVAAIVARNESSRYLTTVLESLTPHCTDILLLDDQSEDDTAEVARSLGCQVKVRTGQRLWGAESTARQELWNWGQEVCEDGWLLLCDADQELVAPVDTWQSLLTAWNVNAWSLKLYDTWDGPQQHRTDGYWQGYRMARPWLFRPSRSGPQQWSDRALHTGHAPLADWLVGTAPESVWYRHRGWEKDVDRIRKQQDYLGQAEHLSPFELAHVESISA